MYQALYRKYRPTDFNSVVGQDSIIKTLKNSIINHNFSHAYMLFGPRGIGKTTISKIFARNINCLSPIDGMACGECDHCKVSFSKDCVDIIEIDAASNNGVDEIRDLKNKISLVPSELDYKVYIIDEVHMLSIGAFNALLKTLEEPPSHAIFILATTDPQKVPETIISRCQCFSFKRISADVVKNRLLYVCNEEKIEIDDEVLDSIAYLSEGGLRDALGLLDKLTSYTNERITMGDFIEINGIISNGDLLTFLEYILQGDIHNVLKYINNLDNSGKNLTQIITQLLNFSRNLIVDYYLFDKKCNFSISTLQNFTNLLNEKMFDMKKSSNIRIYFELFLLKFINDFILLDKNADKITSSHLESNSSILVNSDIKNHDDFSSTIDNNHQNENTLVSENDDEYDFGKEFSDENTDSVVFSNSSEEKSDDDYIPKILNIEDIMKVRINNTFALADKSLLVEENKKFDLLKDFSFDQEAGYIVCALLDGKIRVVSNDNIIISYAYDSNVEQNLQLIDKFSEVYSKITGSNKNFAIISDDQWNTLKNEYINNLHQHIKYQVMDEPKVLLEDLKKNDIMGSSAMDLFGDIVEFE